MPTILRTNTQSYNFKGLGKMEYEAVIGLEVHVQIKAESKIFTRCRAGFGYEPNTLVDPVIMGLPGALPVMNKNCLLYTSDAADE